MKKREISKGKKYSIWIINFSILGLILTSFFPLISVQEDDAVKEDLYFNIEMMKNSDNYEVYSLVDNINFINLLYWGILILGLLSFFCITYLTFLKRWYPIILTFISLAILFLSIFLIFYQYSFIKEVLNFELIHLSSIFHSIAYIHIIFISSIFLMICSFFNKLNVITNLVKQVLISKSKKQLKENEDQQEDSILKPIVDEHITPPPEVINKKVIRERETNLETQKVDKKTQDDIYSQEKKEVKPIETTKEEKKFVNNKIETSKKKYQTGPFSQEKPKEKTQEPVESSTSQSFEDVLSSAIEKKQSELGIIEQNKPTSQEKIKNIEPSSKEKYSESSEVGNQEIESPKEKDNIPKELFVKCPQCTHIFTINKEQATKIICPKCGKEGIAQ